MSVVGLQSSIWSNRFKTTVLIFLFPALLFGLVFLVMLFVRMSPGAQGPHTQEYRQETSVVIGSDGQDLTPIGSTGASAGSDQPPSDYDAAVTELGETLDSPALPSAGTSVALAFGDTVGVFTFLGPVILVWALLSFLFHRQLIFSFTDARPITRKENPEIYNLVENLCISRGLPTPNIGILEDDSMNAFAVGWNPKRSWIVFSRGILNRLSRQEIEAVAAHELTHIMNKDGLLMVTIICFIGAVAAIGEIMFRMARGIGGSRDSDSKGNQLKIIFFLVGLALLILGYVILPLMQLAVSRKREYLADAGSVELTHDKNALISALRNISQDSTIESIKKDSVSALCIENPFPKTRGLANWFHEFFSTHPSIDNRVAMLEHY